MRIPALICAVVAAAGCSASTGGSGQALGAGTPTGTSTSITGWPSPTSTTPTSPPSTTASPTPSPTPSPTATPTPSGPSGRSAPAGALRVLRAHGYDPLPPATWYRTHVLNAQVGVAHDSADGYVRLAFFFVNGRYIGTDTSQPSAIIHYVRGGNEMITLRYAIYRPNDPMCCPTRSANVRYHWTGHRLVPLDPIPPINGTGRR